MYLNKAFLIGNLTRDPEMRAIPNGTKVVQLALATNRTWKDQNGMKKESVEYHNVVAFGKPAEIIAQYAKKGSSLYVEGRMQTRSWDGTDGAKKYRTELVLENFQFGPKTSGGGMPSQAPSANHQSQGTAPDLDTIEYPDDDINPEDIPF
jgi:single-strand DNA-binding protein